MRSALKMCSKALEDSGGCFTAQTALHVRR